MKIHVGDKIKAHGATFEVAHIISEEYFAGDIDIEFYDPAGNYHHYRNWFDRGNIIYAPHKTLYSIEWSKVQSLCIKQEWYSRGNCDAYEHMLFKLIPDEPTGLDTVYAVAEDIYDHSDTVRISNETGFSEDEVLNMMVELIVNECSWISIQ